MNLWLLLGFFLIAAVGYVVLRRLGVAPPLAIALGGLYALLPYHFVRGSDHLWPSLYVAAPMATLLIIRQALGDAAFLAPGGMTVSAGFGYP